MPNVRKKGLKLAGAYVADERDKALKALAKRLGFPDKAAYLRFLFDQALEAGGDGVGREGKPPPVKRTPKGKTGAKGK